ncbi:MAG: 50S ribosomal protein L11 methyltransferase, partial [Deltaproteobacteria bacterium]|nr:50S ribosomal protein L11 methyltransferase [Deltaproteobacteria bacterium]
MEMWLEIKAEGESETKDEAAAILIGRGSPGVLEGDSSLTAFLPASFEGIKSIRKELKSIGWSFTSSPYIDKTDWAEKWKRYIKPVRAAVFFVKPTFSKARKRRGEILINIDPGMAFGTGGHPTTRMCLKGLSYLIKNRKIDAENLLDVGTGSGIIAIGAKKLGLRDVIGIDTDPVALKVARGNLKLNGVKVRLSGKPLSVVKGDFAIVVANIQADTLLSLSSALAGKVRPGGFLLLSGILKEEAGEIKSAYCNAGL